MVVLFTKIGKSMEKLIGVYMLRIKMFFRLDMLDFRYLIENQVEIFSSKLIYKSGFQGKLNKEYGDYIFMSINIHLQNFFMVNSHSIVLICSVLCDE